MEKLLALCRSPPSLRRSVSPLTLLMDDGKNFLTPTRLADGGLSFSSISSSFFSPHPHKLMRSSFIIGIPASPATFSICA